MNPSKRKWLARLEEAAKAQEPAKVQEPVAQSAVEVVLEQAVVQEVVEAPASVEEAPAPVMSSKKKRS